jgi:hypothetical protein
MHVSPTDRRILAEVLIAEYHTFDTLKAAFGVVGTGAALRKRLTNLSKKDYLVRRAMGNDTFSGTGGTYNVYILGSRALSEIDADEAVLARYRSRIRSAQNAKGVNIPHDLLRTEFRSVLLSGERRDEWALDAWVIKRDLDLYGQWNGSERELQPDAFFTLIRGGKKRHFFLEVDTCSYPVDRSDPEGGSSIVQKFFQYESLYERHNGKLWRLHESRLDIEAFSVIHLIRESRSTNPELKRRRVDTTREALELRVSELPAMRRQWLFLSEADLKNGQPLTLETARDGRVGLFG